MEHQHRAIAMGGQPPESNYTFKPISMPSKSPLEEEESVLDRDYEIREQDRWLPLANGMFLSLFFLELLKDNINTTY